MISLSREWIEVSKARTGEEFIFELSNLLKQNNVKDVLECGCGGGHVLYGLSKKGFNCIGIDTTKEMVNYAKSNYSNKNLKYLKLNWKDLKILDKKFDGILCRGNSLSVGTNWEKSKKEFNSEEALDFIYLSLNLMFNSLNQNGFLYVDNTSKKEIQNNGGEIEIKSENLSLKGRINYDWNKRIRYMEGGGEVNGKSFQGNSTSYLMTSKELEDIIKSFKFSKVWKQNMEFEKDYDVICAIK